MSTAALPHRANPSEPALLRFGSLRLTQQQVNLSIITLWFTVTTVQFPYDELFLYPMALYFSYGFFRDWNATWPFLKRGIVLLLLPIWWLISTVWSPEPNLAAKSGLQVVLTIFICMFMATHLNIRQLLTVALIALSIAAIRSLPQALIDLSIGNESKAIYPHKNSLGLDMSILWVTALTLIIIQKTVFFIKIIAVVILPIALLLVFASQSATAILISIGMGATIIGGLVCFGQKNKLTLGRFSILLFILSFMLLILSLLLSAMPIDPVAFLLEILGKDRTLTGRTDLWSIATNEITERPFVGTGAKGYWRYEESHFIRQIFIDYYKKPGNIFHFHNAWLEICVNLGLIGGFFAAIAMIWSMYIIIRCVVLTGGGQNWALLAIGLSVLVRTITEADLFVQFVMLHMLLWTGVLIVASRRFVN